METEPSLRVHLHFLIEMLCYKCVKGILLSLWMIVAQLNHNLFIAISLWSGKY